MSGWGTDNRLGGDFGRWEVFVVIAEEEEEREAESGHGDANVTYLIM